MTKEELEKFYAGEMAQIMDCGHVVCDIFYVGMNKFAGCVVYANDPSGTEYREIEPEVLLKTARLKPKPKVKRTGWIAIYREQTQPISLGISTTDIYGTKEQLLESPSWNAHEPVQITWEEDEE